MRKIILYTASSLDGFIAGPKGEIDWLPQGGDYGYTEFFASVDTTLMGNATYKLTLKLGPEECKEKKNYVFAHNPPKKHLPWFEFVSHDAEDFVRTLKRQKGKDIWLLGGGKLNTTMLNAGLIDEMIVSIIPVILGKGIPLFTDEAKRSTFKTTAMKSFENGVVQVTMRKKR